MEHSSYLFLLMLTGVLFIVVRWVHLTNQGVMFWKYPVLITPALLISVQLQWNLHFSLTLSYRAQKRGDPRLLINNTNGQDDVSPQLTLGCKPVTYGAAEHCPKEEQIGLITRITPQVPNNFLVKQQYHRYCLHAHEETCGLEILLQRSNQLRRESSIRGPMDLQGQGG